MGNDKLVRLSDVFGKCILVPHLNGAEAVMESDLYDIPVVDAVEVVHGEWIWDGYNYDYPWQCSKCGYFEESQKNYCAHCGAKMDRKEEYSAVN